MVLATIWTVSAMDFNSAAKNLGRQRDGCQCCCLKFRATDFNGVARIGTISARNVDGAA